MSNFKPKISANNIKCQNLKILPILLSIEDIEGFEYSSGIGKGEFDSCLI